MWFQVGVHLATLFQSKRRVPKELCFPSHSQEQQIVAKFSTLKWVSAGCSGCLSWKKALRVGGESDVESDSEDSCCSLTLSDPLTVPVFLNR